MPVKHTLYVATFTEREVEVPDVCPACGADLTEMGSLIEWNWNDAGVQSHLVVGPDGYVEAEGESKYGDTYFPESLTCDNCSAEVVPEAVEQDPALKAEGPPPYDAATATGMYDPEGT